MNRPITVTPYDNEWKQSVYKIKEEDARQLDMLHLLKLIDMRIEHQIIDGSFSVYNIINISPFAPDLTEEYFDSLVDQEKIVEVSPNLYQLDIEFEKCLTCSTTLYNPCLRKDGEYVCPECFCKGVNETV